MSNQAQYAQQRDPDLTVKFWLVPHGYQASFYAADGQLLRETLRDFAQTKPVTFWVHRLIVMVIDALANMRQMCTTASRLRQE